MKQLPGKKERNAFNRASPAALAEGNEQELGELSLSGTHEQAVPFLRAASQLGGKVVQFAVQPVIDYNPRKISKKVLAAMSGDPDPVKTLSDIRSLLVGPTRSLHDAMFEEVIDILEESDREVQTALETLESNYYRLSDITDGLVTASVESRDKTRQQTEFFQAELQKSVAGQQEMRLARPPGEGVRTVCGVHVFNSCRFFDRLGAGFCLKAGKFPVFLSGMEFAQVKP